MVLFAVWTEEEIIDINPTLSFHISKSVVYLKHQTHQTDLTQENVCVLQTTKILLIHPRKEANLSELSCQK